MATLFSFFNNFEGAFWWKITSRENYTKNIYDFLSLKTLKFKKRETLMFSCLMFKYFEIKKKAFSAVACCYYVKKNRLYAPVCMFSNRSQRTWKCGTKKYHGRRSRSSLCSRCKKGRGQGKRKRIRAKKWRIREGGPLRFFFLFLLPYPRPFIRLLRRLIAE